MVAVGIVHNTKQCIDVLNQLALNHNNYQQEFTIDGINSYNHQSATHMRACAHTEWGTEESNKRNVIIEILNMLQLLHREKGCVDFKLHMCQKWF